MPKFLLTGEAYDMDKQRKKVVLLKSAKRYDQTDNRQARVAEPSAPTLRETALLDGEAA